MPKGMELTELDKKVLYYQDRGHLVPSRELIKTPEQIEGIRRSGIINTGVLRPCRTRDPCRHEHIGNRQTSL